MDLVRPLGLAGIRSVVVSRPGSAAHYSRYTEASIPWSGGWDRAPELVERLLEFAGRQSQPPVLFFQNDEFLWFASRNRQALAEGFRFVLPSEELVEQLMDKTRFHLLAQQLHLPVPAAQAVCPQESFAAAAAGLDFPLLLKPLTHRDEAWRAIDPAGKALRVESREHLRAVWPQMVMAGGRFLAQQIVPGPETQVESYHVYVDLDGQIAGEFTGRKLRTLPRHYGFSTALEITKRSDVVGCGRMVVRRLGLKGVAKVDFKRAPDGRLLLLEVNPRFNLWHHPGAIAGVNLPSMVWADLTGNPRPTIEPIREGVTWCRLNDAKAARQWGVPFRQWAVWALRCEAKSALAADDPFPLLRAGLTRLSRSTHPRRQAVVGVGPLSATHRG